MTPCGKQSHHCPPNFGCSPEFWGKPVFPRNFPRISQFPPNFLNLFIKSVKITQSPPNLPDFPLKLLKILYVNCYSIIRLLNIRQLDKWKNKIIIAFWWKCENIFHTIGLHKLGISDKKFTYMHFPQNCHLPKPECKWHNYLKEID